MNSSLRLGDVRVMLADARAHVRSTLKTALTHAGLDNIEHTGAVDAIAESLDQPVGPDILICDMGLREGEACELVRSIRHSEIGKNPFICIIGITWNPTEMEVEKVINSGVDLLVVAPMSPTQIMNRVDALVHNRMPFVITENYIGPDRRKEQDREQTVSLMEVPNTLRAKALGLWNAGTMRQEIANAVGVLKNTMVERQAEDIARIADMICEQVNGAGSTMSQPEIERLFQLVTELDQGARARGFDHISELCEACVGVVRKMRDDDAAPAEKDLLLLRHLALAIRKTMRPDESETAIARDIAQTVIAAR